MPFPLLLSRGELYSISINKTSSITDKYKSKIVVHAFVSIVIRTPSSERYASVHNKIVWKSVVCHMVLKFLTLQMQCPRILLSSEFSLNNSRSIHLSSDQLLHESMHIPTLAQTHTQKIRERFLSCTFWQLKDAHQINHSILP